MNKTLSEFFESKKGGKQPVGTSVNPLGAFQIKPMANEFGRPVNFPTPLPQKPFNFAPIFGTDKLTDKQIGEAHPGRDKKSKLSGQAHEGKTKSEGLVGGDHLGKIPTPKIIGEIPEGRDKSIGLPTPEKPAKTKAFSIPGGDHQGRDKAFSLEGQAHTPKDKAFGLKGPDYTTQDPTQPMGTTPEKSTGVPVNPMGQTPEKSTQDPSSMQATPEKSTADIPMMSDPAAKEGYAPSAFGAPIDFSTAELKIHQQQAPKDKKPWQGTAGDGTNWQHLNNLETTFLKVTEPAFTFDDKTPSGGNSYHNFTRGQYNTKFKMVSPDQSNFSTNLRGGEMVPESALALKKGNLLENADEYYKKIGNNKQNDFVSLREEAQRNNPRAPMWMKAPLVQRGIQKGPGNDNPKGILEMINVLTAPVIDLVRISKYLVSPDGLLFMLKQQGLQMTNPKSQFKRALHANRIFNPLAFALQVPANILGIHIDRHNLGPFNSQFDIEYAKLKHDPDNNRLVGLIGELGVGINYTGNTPGAVIDSLSGKMGPNSLFGIIGRTDHKTSKPAFQGGAGIESSNFNPEVPYAHMEAKPGSDANQGTSDPELTSFPGGHGRGEGEFDEYWDKKVKKLGDGDPLTLPTKAAHGFPKVEGSVDPKEEVVGSFKVLDYDQLTSYRKQNIGKGGFLDFRTPDEMEYKKTALSRLKTTDYGLTPGAASEQQDMFGDEPDDDNDFVNIKIVSETPDLTVRARAYNLEVSDKLSPSYSSVSYAGNPAESHIFDKIGRSWQLKFAVPSFSSQELKRNYLRLNNLMRLASPKIVANYASGNILKLTVGNLWDDLPIIIDSFEYGFMDDQWDIAFGEGHETSKFELPMHYEVTMGGKFLENADGSIWNAEGTFFNKEIWADITGE